MKRSLCCSYRGFCRTPRPVQTVVALFAVALMLPLTGCGTVRSLSYPGKDGRIAAKDLHGTYKVTYVGKGGDKSNLDYTKLHVGDQIKVKRKDLKGGDGYFTVTHVSGKTHAHIEAHGWLYRYNRDTFAAFRLEDARGSGGLLNAPLYYLMRVEFDGADMSEIRLQAIRAKWVIANRNRFRDLDVLHINSGAQLFGAYIINGKPETLKKMFLAVEDDPGNALEEHDIMRLKRVSE